MIGSHNKIRRMSKTLTLTLLLLLVCNVLTQTCNQSPQPKDLLQSGTIDVLHSNPPKASQYHSYEVPVSYAVPNSGFQTTASISQYLLSNSFNYAFDYSVRSGASSSANVARVVLLIDEDNSWTKVTISYLISSRQDLVLGHFIAEALISQSNGANQLTFNYGIPKWSSTNKQVTSVAQFAGLRTTSTQPFSLKFLGNKINAVTGVLTLDVSTNVTSPFDTLHIAYYWWIVGPTLAFQSFNPAQNPTLAYKFIGLEQINNKQLGYEGSGFNHVGSLDCVGSSCSQKCVTPLECQQQGGIISGANCFRCGSGFTLQNGQCIKSTPTCPKQHEEWDGSKCSCKAGYYRINGVCVTCPQNESWDGQECVCDQGYTRYSGVCSLCPPNAVYLPGTHQCQCKDTYYPISGSCVKCDVNSKWDNSKATCVCNDGYYGDYTLCTKCHTSCGTCSGGASNQCTGCKGGDSLSGGECSNNITPTHTAITIALTGTVVGNGRVYQGVSMSSVPLKFLIEDCINCADLLRVQVIAQGVTVGHKVSYVKNSNYWFIIEFDYSDTGITPVFQYTVQLNPIHATYFRMQDLVQKLYQTINPVTLPPIGGTPPPQEPATDSSSRPIVQRLQSSGGPSEVINEDGNTEQLPFNAGQLFG